MNISTATYLAISIAAARRVLRKMSRGKAKRAFPPLGDTIVQVKPMTDKQAMYYYLNKMSTQSVVKKRSSQIGDTDMQNKNKKNNPYQFDIKTVKLSECSPDDIRVEMAKKVLANSQRVRQEPDYHTGSCLWFKEEYE